jgi:hypothetical protein
MIHSLNPDHWKRDLVVIGSVLVEYSLAGYLGSKGECKRRDGNFFLMDLFFLWTSCQLSSGMFNFFSASLHYVEDYLPGLSGPWTLFKESAD